MTNVPYKNYKNRKAIQELVLEKFPGENILLTVTHINVTELYAFTWKLVSFEHTWDRPRHKDYFVAAGYAEYKLKCTRAVPDQWRLFPITNT